MKSSYRLNSLRVNGPPTSIYPLGFFVEDYSYYENNDESYLDENNGRFCVTPDFPNGTYAYFATVTSGNTAIREHSVIIKYHNSHINWR